MPRRFLPDELTLGAWRLDANDTDLVNLAPTAAPAVVNHGTVDEAVSGMPWTSAKRFVEAESDYMTVADHAVLKPTDVITVGLWFNATSWVGGNPFLINKNSPSWNAGWYLYYNAISKDLFWGHYSGGAYRGISNAGGEISTGEWHHAEASIGNGITPRLYLDGEPLSGTVNPATAALTPYSGTMYIGAQPGPADEFDGLIVEPYMLNKQRTPWEIAQEYNAVRDRIDGLRVA